VLEGRASGEQGDFAWIVDGDGNKVELWQPPAGRRDEENSLAIYQLADRVPQIDPSAFVFDNATVIGHVIIGRGANVWPYATLRGDNEPVVVGEGSTCRKAACCTPTPAAR